MWALKNYYFEIAKLLLKYKPEVRIQDKVIFMYYNGRVQCNIACVCTERVVSVGAGLQSRRPGDSAGNSGTGSRD